jgi:hypothetical protein
MAKRKVTEEGSEGGRLRRAASSVGKAVRHAASKLRPGSRAAAAAPPTPSRQAAAPKSSKPAARAPRRQADIPMDAIASTYVPPQTGMKSGFRSDGRDRQLDQDLIPSAADDRFNDEDRITNKSGDPRIGTHRRTYEPGERDEAQTR